MSNHMVTLIVIACISAGQFLHILACTLSRTCKLMYSMFACSSKGLQIGTVLGMPIAGVLCASDFLGGWPSAFYIFGKWLNQDLFFIVISSIIKHACPVFYYYFDFDS